MLLYELIDQRNQELATLISSLLLKSGMSHNTRLEDTMGARCLTTEARQRRNIYQNRGCTTIFSVAGWLGWAMPVEEVYVAWRPERDRSMMARETYAEPGFNAVASLEDTLLTRIKCEHIEGM